MKPPVARIATVAWTERVIPSPTVLRILDLPSGFTLAFCGFSTPGARGKAGGERGEGGGIGGIGKGKV